MRRALQGLFPRSVVLFAAFFLLLRLCLAALAGPGFDEAYYYVYALHPAFSYFDHPPVVGLLAGFGPLLTGIASAFTIRLGAVLLFSISSLLLYRLASRAFGTEAAMASFLLFNATPFFLVGAGIAILPDAGLAFFWLLALSALWGELFEGRSSKNWLLFGLFAGCALLSKYHAILIFVCLVPYILIYRRDKLRSPAAWISILIALAVFSPVLIWNAMHGWASFLFQGRRSSGLHFNPVSLAQGLGGQIAFLTPMVFIPACIVVFRLLRKSISGRDAQAAFFLFLGAGPIVFFTAIAATRQILPHWTMIGWLTLCIPLGAAVAVWWRRWALFRIGAVLSILLSFCLLGLLGAQMKYGVLHLERFVAAGTLDAKALDADVTIDTFGWDAVSRYVREKGLAPDRTFFVVHRWYVGGQVELATEGTFKTLSFDSLDARGYAIWDRTKEVRGMDAVLVYPGRYRPSAPDQYAQWFEKYEGLDSIPMYRGGVKTETYYFARYTRLRERFPLQVFSGQ